MTRPGGGVLDVTGTIAHAPQRRGAPFMKRRKDENVDAKSLKERRNSKLYMNANFLILVRYCN